MPSIQLSIIMKAMIRTKAGKNFSTLKVQTIPMPSPQSHQVTIKMKAARVNPVDMDLMKGFPGLSYASPTIGGVDGSGTVVALGSAVKDYQAGDQVFFYRKFSEVGTWAEYITINVSDIAPIPKSLDLIEAGSIALPLLTAYESLMALNPKAGASILIHGAGGGVGFQAVQLANLLGLEVIANGSARDQQRLESVGVARFINYKTTDFYQALQQQPPTYVLDVLGGATLLQSIALKAQKVVSIALPNPHQMHKTGVQLAKPLALLMNFMNRKYLKAAKKQGVELIGQVTGANGKHLDAAARLVEQAQNYQAPIKTTYAWSDLETQGLSPKALGATLLLETSN